MRPKQPSSWARMSTGRSSPASCVATAASTSVGKFFKLFVRLVIAFRVPRARHHLAPAMTMKQPINGAVIDFVSNVLFKGAPGLPYRRDLPTLGLHKKRGQELLFFCQGEILPPSTTLAWRFNRCNAEAVVAGDYRMNSCFGNSTVPGNLRSCPWLDQGLVDNEPALPRHRAGIGPHPVFHFCNGQMGDCMGHSCHVFFSSRFTWSKRLEIGQQSTEMMRCFPGALKSSVPARLLPEHFHKTQVIL